MKTNAAKAAALIRKEIKAAFPGLKFSCTSENYSGGDSIRVKLTDQSATTRNAIKAMTAKYQYGHFDGMTDCYNYDNVKNDLPQVKFLFVDNEMSEEKKEEVYQNIKNIFQGGKDLPPNYRGAENVLFHGQWISQLVWQHFNQQA